MGVARGFKAQENTCKDLFVYYLVSEYTTVGKPIRNGLNV